MSTYCYGKTILDGNIDAKYKKKNWDIVRVEGGEVIMEWEHPCEDDCFKDDIDCCGHPRDVVALDPKTGTIRDLPTNYEF